MQFVLTCHPEVLGQSCRHVTAYVIWSVTSSSSPFVEQLHCSFGSHCHCNYCQHHFSFPRYNLQVGDLHVEWDEYDSYPALLKYEVSANLSIFTYTKHKIKCNQMTICYHHMENQNKKISRNREQVNW